MAVCLQAVRRGPAASELVSVRAMERLRQALIPRYQSLFTQISRLDNGVKFLANLRADVIVSYILLNQYQRHNC